MQSNEIKKKLEHKLTQLQRQIDEKEFEKSRKKQELKEKRTQKETLKSDDLRLVESRNEIETEITNINGELRKEKSEMTRLHADLVYKTRQEYENMIKRYEREMQFNNQAFRRNEETRILREIASLKNGIVLLEKYEQKKLVVTRLQETLQLRVNARELNWTQRQQNNTRIRQLDKEMGELRQEINQINTNELAEKNDMKIDLKKKLEDLNREINARHQQLRKESLENRLRSKALKKDEILMSMEDTLRDLNKLINYFQKLIDSGIGMDSQQQQQQRILTKSTLETSSSSSSLNASVAHELCEQLNANKKLSLTPLTLLNDINNFAQNTSNNSEISASSTTLSTPCVSALNTPTTPEQFGSFFVRKSLEETRTKRQIRKQKSNKNNKVAHSLDIINLLNKMNVPIQLSSQYDECLRELASRKQTVLNEMQVYTSENAARVALDERAGADNFESKSRDSNYESDNNSVTSFQSSMNNVLEKLTSSNFNNDNNSSNIETQLGAIALDVASTSSCLATNLKVQRETSVTSIFVNNSDDSDATIHESQQLMSSDGKRDSVSRLLNRSKSTAAKIKINSSKSSSASSDSTTTPGSPNTPTPHVTDKLDDTETSMDRSFNSTPTLSSSTVTTTKINEDDSSFLLNNKDFMRQLSDGYSSSNTPLSASSISNELPTVNVFFQTTTKSSE